MSDQITTAMVQQFSDNLYMLFQQSGTRLRGTTRERSVTGASDFWDRIGPVTAVRKTVRHGDTPQITTPLSRRRVDLVDWEWADLIDLQDVYRVLIDPQSAYTENGAKALARAFDQSIIDGFDADAKAGKDGGTTVTFVSEAAADLDLSDHALLVQDIVSAKGAMDLKDVPEEGRHIVLPPVGFTQLLRQPTTPNLTSSDYNKLKALVAGEIDEFLGFTFHRSTLLPRPGENLRYAFAWHVDAMGTSISSEIETQVKERADKSYSTQVKVSGTFAAVRIQGEGVVRMKLDETK